MSGLPSFPATDKRKDPRFKWFSQIATASVAGNSMRWTPTIFATAFRRPIIELIEPVAWKRCEVVNRAEQESLRTILQKWKGAR